MKASQLVARPRVFHRKVGIVVPEGRSAVGIAVDLLRELGVDPEIAGRTLYLEVGVALSAQVAGLFERRTGIPAFNEWGTS